MGSLLVVQQVTGIPVAVKSRARPGALDLEVRYALRLTSAGSTSIRSLERYASRVAAT